MWKKFFICVCVVSAVLCTFLGCGPSDVPADETGESSVQNSAGQDTAQEPAGEAGAPEDTAQNSAGETADKLQTTGDTDGDGLSETLRLNVGEHGIGACLCVDGAEVLPFTVKGEYDFSYAELYAADMDLDGRDEVLVLSDIPAKYKGFMIQCAQLEDGQWKELPAPELDVSFAFLENWACSVSVNGREQTVAVNNADARAALFHENGVPALDQISTSFYTDAPGHRIEGETVRFTLFVSTGGYDAEGSEVQYTLELQAAVYVEDGALAVDADALMAGIAAVMEQKTPE